jgi:hypothetical protein
MSDAKTTAKIRIERWSDDPQAEGFKQVYECETSDSGEDGWKEAAATVIADAACAISLDCERGAEVLAKALYESVSWCDFKARDKHVSAFMKQFFRIYAKLEEAQLAEKHPEEIKP